MDQHVKDLFAAAQPFDEGELYQSPEYEKAEEKFILVEEMAEKLYGAEVAALLPTYLEAWSDAQEIECLHFFNQGYQYGLAKGARNQKHR